MPPSPRPLVVVATRWLLVDSWLIRFRWIVSGLLRSVRVGAAADDSEVLGMVAAALKKGDDVVDHEVGGFVWGWLISARPGHQFLCRIRCAVRTAQLVRRHPPKLRR